MTISAEFAASRLPVGGSQLTLAGAYAPRCGGYFCIRQLIVTINRSSNNE
jgi:hypothetical protein